jgi:hypothetical protein
MFQNLALCELLALVARCIGLYAACVDIFCWD